MNHNIRKFAALFVAVALCFSSCKNDEEEPQIIPDPEKEVEVEVKPLLKVTVPSTWLGVNDERNTYDGWVFLSDSKGQTLGVKKIANSEVLEFEKPATFTDEQLFINIVRVRKIFYGFIYGNNYEVSSYPVKVSSEVNLTPSSVASPYLGNGTVVVKNIPALTLDNSHPFLTFEGQKGTLSSHLTTSDALTFGFSLTQTPAKALLSIKTIENEPYKYKFIDKLETGMDYEEDFSDLVPMENTVEFEYPEGNFHYTTLDAYTEAGDNSTIYNLGMSTDKMPKLYYPKDVFKEFSTFAYFTTATSSHYYHKVGTPMTSFEPLAISMNVTKKSVDGFEFTSTGTYDTYGIIFSSFKEVDNNQNYFTFYSVGLASNSVQGVIPTIPAEIVEAHPAMDRSSLVMARIGFDEYSQMDGKEYLENLLMKGFSGSKSYQSTSLIVATPDQRKAMSEEAAKKEFEEFVKRATYK